MGNKEQRPVASLSHFDDQGAARMVDVSDKRETVREAVAKGRIAMQPGTLALILDRKVSKGDVFGVARVAGIMAAKRTPDLIPLTHPLRLSSVEIAFEPDVSNSSVLIKATVRTMDRTGVEMEALSAVVAAGLTIYDMCKSADRAMVITDVCLMKKTGGKSGAFNRTSGS